MALFTIGAVLARAQRMELEQPHRRLQARDYLPVVAIKLLVHPLLVFLAGTLAIRWGARIEPMALKVMVLVAALPSASNVSMLAERMGADNGRIARIILVTTALAFFTFSAMVAWIDA